ncbi:MAG TPA: laccase domain-containing protein, partial [Rhodoferax sp.]|nr:laccase domain-containing protein [Rhodoferax sp.]
VVMVADCLPVLLCDTQGRRVAAAHAGWRGLVGTDGKGILEASLEPFRPLAPVEYAQGATEIIAWLGPCIGPEAFEVGDEVRTVFVDVSPEADRCFRPLRQGKWLADLAGLARQRLQALGVTGIYGNDSTAAWCTVTNPSRFFSHRRDRVSGRQAACIWLE